MGGRGEAVLNANILRPRVHFGLARDGSSGRPHHANRYGYHWPGRVFCRLHRSIRRQQTPQYKIYPHPANGQFLCPCLAAVPGTPIYEHAKSGGILAAILAIGTPERAGSRRPQEAEVYAKLCAGGHGVAVSPSSAWNTASIGSPNMRPILKASGRLGS